jgi:hypothetical protein
MLDVLGIAPLIGCTAVGLAVVGVFICTLVAELVDLGRPAPTPASRPAGEWLPQTPGDTLTLPVEDEITDWLDLWEAQQR